MAVMPGELSRAFERGVTFDASAIAGFGGGVRSDLFLRPDPSTLSLLPWRPENGRVVRMFCDIVRPDGSPFECDTRAVLKSAVADAGRAGYAFTLGSQMEFYLFKIGADGNPTHEPHDNAGYMDIAPGDRGENVRREICLTLEQMGIIPESSHHEEGPGQNEIDFRFSDPLYTADNAVTFHSVVSTIAARNGLSADFTPKPLADKPGSGMHINISASSSVNPDPLPQIIAGILEKIGGMTVFLNPHSASYTRLGTDKSPGYATWGFENRSALIRVPGVKREHRRAELRSADATANPYLAFALMLRAGLYGLENKLALPESADLNLFTAPEDELSKYKKLPCTLEEAMSAARDCGFIRENIPEKIIDAYCGR
jgi:glutamine synthetase